jgi:hypothetical protein
MTMRTGKWLIGMLVFLAAGSCATVGDRGAAELPGVRVALVNFVSSTDIGITTEIHFSVVNETDQELKDLTLTVETNPSNGVDVPFSEKIIDRIPPHGSWAPDEPFLVRGRRPGETAVFFIVAKDGITLAKDYTLISVGPGQFY